MSATKDKTTSPPPAGKTLAKLAGGERIQAIVPTTLGEVFAMAEMVHKAGLAPNSVNSPQQLTIIFLKAMELGMLPMAAMECIGIINGKACLHSDGIPSLLWAHGFKIREWYENEDKLDQCMAHCEITRPEGEKYTFKYAAQDAKDNGLWDTREKDSKGNPNKAPWFRYKKRMLKMRCRGWLARDCASDVLKGIPIYEEQADIELGRDEYREVKQAALAVPDDIPDEPAAEVVSEAEVSQDGPIINPDFYLTRLGEELEAATDKAVFDEVWASHLEASDGRLPRVHQQAAEALRDKHTVRSLRRRKGPTDG